MKNLFLKTLLLSAILMLSACNKAHQRAFRKFRQIEEMKKYGLVFRLQDYKQRINYFEKKGMTDRARLEQSKIEQTNRNLVEYFQKEFNFCPVRFYYASQQNELKAGKPVLLNNEMEPDTSIPLPDKVILANFGIGKVVDNTFQSEAFRVEGTSIRIRPIRTTWWHDEPMQLEDVRRVNQVLNKRMNQGVEWSNL